MWLIKLPFRIIALPIMAIVAVFSIFYFLALNLSAMVAGLLYLVLGVCIVMLLFQHVWIYAALVFGFAVLVFLAVMFSLYFQNRMPNFCCTLIKTLGFLIFLCAFYFK